MYWLRKWGGLLNATAILIFVGIIAWVVYKSKKGVV
jgi:dipeptide/tripeptide permease